MHTKSNDNGLFAVARRQLTLLLVSIVVVLYVASALAIYTWMNRLTLSEIDTVLQVNARPEVHKALLLLITGDLSGFADSPTSPPGLGHSGGGAQVVVRDATGHVLFESQQGLANQWATLLASGQGQLAQSYQTLGSKQSDVQRVLTLHVAIPSLGTFGIVQFGMSIAKEMAELTLLQHVLVAVGAVGAFAALALGFFVSDRALQPIARSWRRQRQFVADASHELRTPLAVIQSNLDVVLRHTDGSVLDNLEWLNNAKGEARRLTKLTEDLLTLARTDSAQTQISRTSVALIDVVNSVVEGLTPLAEIKGIQIQVDAPQPQLFYVTGDSGRLHQLLVILLDNAIKYTEQGQIIIRLVRLRTQIKLQVQDTGIGVDKQDLSQIFERFYRGDKARERTQGGVGLGLAIAKWIVEVHGGRIQAQSTLEQGTIFTVLLPAELAVG